jgi:integrase
MVGWVNRHKKAYLAATAENQFLILKIEKEAWTTTTLQKYAKRIVVILLLTGMRLGELLNLRWDNIQDDKIVLKRTETKQRKKKMIPITSGMREALESLRDGRRKDGFVHLSVSSFFLAISSASS